MMRMDLMCVLLATFGGLFGMGRQVKCGTGTVDKNGECSAVSVVSPAVCAPGTKLVGTQCVSETTCGMNTVRNDAGVCVGTGGEVTGDGGGCTPLQCPPQATSRYCVTGKVTRWADAGKPLDMRAKVTKDDSACVKIYSPTDFVVGTVAALGSGEAHLDPCGRFMVTDIIETSTKFIAVAVDDCAENPSPVLAGSWALVAVGGEQIAGQSTIDLTSGQTTAIGMTVAEAEALKTQAGRDVYGQGGSYIAIFRDPRNSAFPPVEGVIPFGVTDDYINMSNAIYFGADLNTLDKGRAFTMGTGVTGAVLINPPHVTQHSGRGDSGMIPWDTILGGSTDGAFFVQRWRLKRQ